MALNKPNIRVNGEIKARKLIIPDSNNDPTNTAKNINTNGNKVKKTINLYNINAS